MAWPVDEPEQLPPELRAGAGIGGVEDDLPQSRGGYLGHDRDRTGDDVDVLVIDAANVVGSRPNGWWRDRAKAAADLCAAVRAAVDAGRLESPVVVVLEGAARQGSGEHDVAGLRVVHAAGSGDDAIVDLVQGASGDDQGSTVVTADRELRARVTAVGADVCGPRWLLDRI